MNARRFLWAVVLIALAVMLLMAYLRRQMLQAPPATTQTAPATQPAPATTPATVPSEAPEAVVASAPAAPTTGPATATTTEAAESQWRNDTWSVHERTLGSVDRRSGYKLEVQLTSRGAAVETIKLAEDFETVEDRRRYQRDPATYEQAVGEDPKLKGHYVVLKPFGEGEDEIYPLATRRIRFPDEDVALGLAGPRWLAGKVDQKEASQSVTFTSEIFRDGKPFVRLEKTYSLAKGSYSLRLALRVANLTGEKLSAALTQYGPSGVLQEDHRSDRRALAWGRYEKDELKVFKEGIGKAGKMQPGPGGAQSLGRSDATDAVLWIGQVNKYFAALAYLVPEEATTLKAPRAKTEFFKVAVAESAKTATHLPVMEHGAFDIAAGNDVQVELDLFAGPKKRSLFNQTPLYKTLRYKDTLDFGSCFCAFAPLSLAMMWLLDVFSAALFHNYGLAIILLVVLVRVALHPLTRKGQASMAKMQKLQPELQSIREKYKDDKAKLNQEMMKLYKSQGASPMLGCLPMFLQMPIWIALWTGLQAAVELRHAAFLPVWITDLAAPDALWDFGRTVFSLPLVGPVSSFNLLPLLLTVAMVLQQKLTPSPPTSDQQARTQKQMMYFMSVFFLLIFYNAPSGLTLYIMASTFAGVAEQYTIRKHIREKDAAEAAVETRVAIPGKRFRGQKPKKPKGPFRFTK